MVFSRTTLTRSATTISRSHGRGMQCGEGEDFEIIHVTNVPVEGSYKPEHKNVGAAVRRL